MGLFYKQQNKIEALSKKTGLPLTGNRASDLASSLYGDRGNTFDELKYLRNENASDEGVDIRNSDAWITYAGAKGVTTNRADQLEREFYKEKAY